MSGGKKGKRKYYQSNMGVSRYNLITFGMHDPNSLPSDDSDDASYEPTSSETSQTAGKKRKRGTSDHYQNKPKRKKHCRQDASQSLSPYWSDNIPNELLYKIFWHGVCNSGAVPFLCRAAQVCRKWNLVAPHPSLWRWVDVSFMAHFPRAKDETITTLCERKLLSNVEELNVSGWKRLTSASLEVIMRNCPGLTSLNLTGCNKVTACGLTIIASSHQNLTNINLSSIRSDATSNMSLKSLLKHQGNQMNALYLAENKLVGLPTLKAIQTFCRSLRILDLSNTSISNFPIECLQACCPKIVELRLAQLSLLPSMAKSNEMEASAGFPDLELLSLASITGGDGTDDMLLRRRRTFHVPNLMLMRLLKTSTKLRQLDLRGCVKISHQGLVDLPIASLEQLFLSRCKICWKDLFSEIGQKWKHSLKDLDVSWCSNLYDTALIKLAFKKSPNTVLSSLNVAGSGVTGTGVRAILDACPNLKQLNLTSCRGVPRGLKQLHELGIKHLREQLRAEPEQVDLEQDH